MMDFKQYPNYKDSGIHFLGHIPEHWDVLQTRHLFNFAKGLTITKEDLGDEGVPCINYGEVHSKYGFEFNPIDNLLKYVSPEFLETNKNCLLNKGDFVFADTSEDLEGSGNFSYLNQDALVFAGYHSIIARLKSLVNNARYFAYLFDSQAYRNQLRSEMKGVKVYSVSQGVLKSRFAWLPPIEEQNQIVAFLDTETSRIDNLISKQEKLIEVLEEHRNTLTAYTIEKGIKSDTKIINSGVEWLGEVPENWKVGRLKNFAKVNPTINKFSLDANELIEFIPMSNVDDKKGVIASIDYRKFGEVSTGYTAFNTSDVVFAKITPCMENGNCAIIPELKHGFGYGTTEFIVFRPSDVIKTEFLYFLLRSKKLRDICTAFMTGTAGQQRISSEFLANYPIALPDLQEQQEIINFLHEKNQKIDNLIYKQKALILKLKEYRTSIISHAVTGKIDVRDLVA